ncbi:NXPE family member 2-like [Pelobates fuscus]|uniref:NXPE family member 2-like n=1 Tax=Pelobates fuscus TaxID=191477 RepID=UPI002FE48C37
MYQMKCGFIMTLAVIIIMVLSFLFNISKHQVCRYIVPVVSPSENMSELQIQVNTFLDQINKIVPRINDIQKNKSTCARNSKLTIINPKDKYCVGDILIVQVDMFDYLRKRKSYGGDFLKARISSPEFSAAASGKVEDFKNGTYHIHFTLFWEGKILVSVFLFYPSEGVAALWNARNSWYGYIAYTGKFINQNKKIETKCGFERDNSKELCEYADHRDEEYFFCVKPWNISCDSFTEIRGSFTKQSYLTKESRSLFDKTDIRLEIPNAFGNIMVVNCSNNLILNPRCKIGMELKYPSGHFIKNAWYPNGCSIQTYRSTDELNRCMQGKLIYLFGDSTLRQWIYNLQSNVKTLTVFSPYGDGWASQLLGIDLKRNIMVRWKRHTRPFLSGAYQSFREERTIPREIDLIGGHKNTVIVLNIGVHFRPHPLHLYIRRIINIQRALKRLFLRSPETKVIIKTEHSGENEKEYEINSSFHGYVHYLIMEQIFKDLNVGFVNAWDMTNAFNSNIIHPPNTYIQHEVDMLMTYIC